MNFIKRFYKIYRTSNDFKFKNSMHNKYMETRDDSFCTTSTSDNYLQKTRAELVGRINEILSRFKWIFSGDTGEIKFLWPCSLAVIV